MTAYAIRRKTSLLIQQVGDKMARDAELDRLKAAQDRAFQRKQDAYQAQQAAWEKRSDAREAMNRAFEAKQRAYDAQQSAWQEFQRVRASNGPRIDVLNAQQETAFQSMKRAYDNASSAYDRRDGASASSYAAEGRGYKEEAQRCVAERRRLVDEIRSARGRLEPYKLAFQQAKEAFAAAKAKFELAKAAHEKAQADFKRAKADFDSCTKAFKSRLEKVRAEGKRRREDKRSIAEKAGVPYSYRDNVWVSKKPDGTVNIYFGGVGKPNGLGHGHYVMDRNGKVTYRRDPFDPHGAQNFTEPVYWQKAKMSLDRDSGNFQTDNYIGIVGDKGQKSKAHIAVSSSGDIVFVRDLGGEVLYDRKRGIGHLPNNLDWSK